MSAIYGFHFTKEFEASGLRFYPTFSDPLECRTATRSLDEYKLTGFVFGEDLSRNRIFDLQAILSFIEHIDVRLSQPIQSDLHIVERILPTVSTEFPGPRFSGGGAVIATDDFYRGSRKNFIELALRTLEDKKYCDSSKFKLLFFKKIETFRRQPFIEITYFLLFSGLEAFCRSTCGKPTDRSATESIYRSLKGYGFNVFQENPADLRRSISTYSHIRNTIFHEGDFKKLVNTNGKSVEINSSDYLFSFSMLISLAIMKVLGFDDGHTNWDSWIDRQLNK